MTAHRFTSLQSDNIHNTLSSYGRLSGVPCTPHSLEDRKAIEHIYRRIRCHQFLGFAATQALSRTRDSVNRKRRREHGKSDG
jgi:hypothetical protein